MSRSELVCDNTHHSGVKPDHIVYERIRLAVLDKRSLAEPFSARDIRRFARGWTYARSFGFLAYNCTDNAHPEQAMFVRVDRGKYKLLRRSDG